MFDAQDELHAPQPTTAAHSTAQSPDPSSQQATGKGEEGRCGGQIFQFLNCLTLLGV
jgi:hypothetical protein